jgi:hypothetical protein
VGLALGAALARYIESWLYGVTPTEWRATAFPLLTLLATAMLAALPTVVRALGINPAGLLRTE